MGLCPTCNISIPKEDRVTHVRSEWHVYNLKRVVASLPPIDETLFNEKRKLFSEVATPAKKTTYCKACKKLFANSRSYEAHLVSKKHVHNARSRISPPSSPNRPPPEPSSTNPESDEPMPESSPSLPLGSCLFCERQLKPDLAVSDEDERNQALARRVLTHMFHAHKFTVPHEDRLRDAAGLLRELGRIVGEERACLACGRQFYGLPPPTERSGFKSVPLKAVRQHMLNKSGHMRVWCGEEDPVQVSLMIAEHEEAGGGGSTGPPTVALAGGELFSRFYDQSVVVSPLVLPGMEDDGDEAYEVRLPSGSVISHRSLSTVYKQRIPLANTTPDRSRVHALPSNRTAALTNRMFGSLTVTQQQAALLTRPNASVRTADRHSDEARRYWDLSTGIRGNLVYRGHLRRQY